MIVLILASVDLAVFGCIFLFSFLKSRGVYEEYLESVDKKEYAFKDFIPIGLFINEKINIQKILPKSLYKHFYKYESSIKGQIIELYGIKYVDYYLMIHNGNKIAVALTIAAGSALLAVILGAQGDYDNCRMFLIASIAAFVGMQLIADKELRDKIEKRRISLQMEFPDFINKLTLLVNAGMTISKAWEKIVTDNKRNTPLYNEMTIALGEIRSGKPEAIAYEEFGRRCKVKEIIKFVSVIILNLKKGGAEVVPVLKAQGIECWEMRKNVAKRLGEEASSKLLLPMSIMLVGIMIIVILPAVMQLMNM